ncbi:hypothetical protein CkaCkLH20_00673 [Colletotrichum karsti]|uniref:Uncharacterized protein n=1 Tax=Colletotrichum karsti TaxID=1095194 RepID=A0A9P6IFM1_9PEZI|nr:uncharacterized protein CkaCkLH20_00673 [Colletotrichum karsti]KAF9881527.1 hypothetical protein CkaCkLH20_00673 [Colletotrichum karsti]
MRLNNIDPGFQVVETVPEMPAEWITTKNSAARFANRAVSASETVGTAEELVFVDDLDCFVPKSQVPDLNKCFDKSREHLGRFESTLQRFAQNMETRKALKSFGYKSNDTACLNLTDVFIIANRVVEQRDGTGSWGACKSFARRCVRSANSQDSALGAIMSMVPSGDYGSVLSGGIMTILAVAHEHEKKRQSIENALADIPKKLDKIKRLSDVHIKSKRLHGKADGILVATFVVLEEIVNDLTMDWKAKTKTKIKNFGTEDKVADALTLLDSSISEFQDELQVCSERRMGRMHEAITENGTLLKTVEELAQVTDLREDRVNAIAFQNKLLDVVNSLTRLYASHPNFNPVNGGVKSKEPLAIQPAHPVETSSSVKEDESLNLATRNAKIVKKWVDTIKDFEPSSEKHLRGCIRAGLGQLTSDDREKSQWIMSSSKLRDWLRLDRRSILAVKAENAPQELFNPFSFTAAILAETLQRSTNYAVLSFFCGLRKNDNFDSEFCDPMACVKSLNGQLLKFCLEKRPDVDLSQLQQRQQNKRLMKNSTKKLEYAVKLLRGLLKSLEDQDVIFIILESWSRIRGDRDEADWVIEKLCKAVAGFPQLKIKLLVLDALPGDPVYDFDMTSTLYVPEEIDGWQNDVSLSRLEGTSLNMVDELERRRHKDSDCSSGSDSDDSEED